MARSTDSRRNVTPLSLGALVFFGMAATAEATDTTTVVYPGITYIKRILSDQRIHILKVDLSLKTIRVHATKPPGGMKTSAFAAAYGCEVALNGDFGTVQPPWRTTGLAMGGGELWTTTKDTVREGWTAFGRDNSVKMALPADNITTPEPWMWEIVGGRPIIVHQGVVLDPVPPYSYDGCDPHFCARHPRTAYGLSQDEKTFIAAVVEGRNSPVAIGMTTKELGTLMKGLGAWTAMNEDGGGSSTMFIEKLGGVVSDAVPNEGERTVSNHLGFSLVEPVGTLKGNVRDATAAGDPRPGLPGATVRLSSGAETTAGEEGAFELTEVPAGPVTVTASFPGYAEKSETVTIFSADTVTTTLLLDHAVADAATPAPLDAGSAVDGAAGSNRDLASNETDATRMDMAGGCSCEVCAPLPTGDPGTSPFIFILVVAGLVGLRRQRADKNGRGRPMLIPAPRRAARARSARPRVDRQR